MAESSAFEKVVGFRVIFDILGFVFTAVDLFLWLVGLSGTPLWVVGSVGFTLFVVGIVGHVSANAESSYLTLGDLRGDLVSPHKEFSRSPAKIREPPEQPPLRLTVRIIETFVLPHKDGTAECFLQLSVHNETEVKCSNPLKYGVSLTINKKSYAFTSPLNLHDFKIVQYKIVEKWHDGEPYEAEQELAKTSLRLNVLGEKDYLLKGKPLLGWLGVQVHYLPKWKYHEELIRYNEYSPQDEETGEIHYEYEPEYDYTPTLQTLEVLRLEVTDPYGQVWPVETTSFNPRGKRIEDLRLLSL